MGAIYGLIGAAILAAISFGAGFHYGGKLVQAEWDAERVKLAAAAQEQRETIEIADQQTDVKSVKKRAKRKAKAKSNTQEVIQHAQSLPDPVECHLAPERVRVINAAWGFGDTADFGRQAATMPATDATVERKPQ